MEDYLRDIEIDPELLDVEWLQHPKKVMKYIELAAAADKDVKRLKEKMDIVRAQQDEEARKRMERNEEKITEAKVTAFIVQSKEMKEAQDALREAEYDAVILKGAVNAFGQRKNALENLVTLYLAGYFSGPKEPHNLTDIKNKALERADKNIRKRLNKKREENDDDE